MAGDVEARLRAADGLPEIDVETVLEVAALFRRGLFLFLPAAAAEELGEDIAEPPAASVSARLPPPRPAPLPGCEKNSEKSKPPKSMPGCGRAPVPAPPPGIPFSE